MGQTVVEDVWTYSVTVVVSICAEGVEVRTGSKVSLLSLSFATAATSLGGQTG